VFYLTNATYEGHVLIQLTPPGDAVLVNGTTPQESPANFSDLAVEASTGAVTITTASNTAIAAANWNALWTDYTTANSFGRLIRQIFNKVMSLR
jgi:hypothetical protein